MREILNLEFNEAKEFFLKEESYCNFDLPTYFVFQNLLEKISNEMSNRRLQDFFSDNKKPANFEDVNYKFLNNKDGRFAWRPLQLIHPVIYVSLVNMITQDGNWNLIKERFEKFRSNENIRCYSIPLMSETKQSNKAASVSRWWQEVEQQALELSLQYEYVLHTDISDCYGLIYTHSIPWALHTKEIAKKQRNDNSLIGNVIDKHIQYMSYGQTNGIPQGSVLMDFIAEIVLGYIDYELSRKIESENLTDYEIIRYRDDYRIFSNNPQIIEHITKLLTEVLMEHGMRLNEQKTKISNNVIRDSLKPDKLFWIMAKRSAKNLQNHLLIIHRLAEEYPNSGSLVKALFRFNKRIEKLDKTKQNLKVLIAILVDIMFKNPRTYPIASAILSKFLTLIPDNDERKRIIDLICKRFDKIPNTGHLKIWLQRITIKLDRYKPYDEKLCEKVYNPSKEIWNSEWLNDTMKNLIKDTPLIDEETISKMTETISSEEVALFKWDYDLPSDIEPEVEYSL